MGAYTDNLYRRSTRIVERLTGAAILRLGHCHAGARSHAEIRSSLGDEDPYSSKPGDTEGFMTSKNRFVTRDEAVGIGQASGQVSQRFYGRDLLSSDIDW